MPWQPPPVLRVFYCISSDDASLLSNPLLSVAWTKARNCEVRNLWSALPCHCISKMFDVLANRAHDAFIGLWKKIARLLLLCDWRWEKVGKLIKGIFQWAGNTVVLRLSCLWQVKRVSSAHFSATGLGNSNCYLDFAWYRCSNTLLNRALWRSLSPAIVCMIFVNSGSHRLIRL